jgi:hypothetical protein
MKPLRGSTSTARLRDYTFRDSEVEISNSDMLPLGCPDIALIEGSSIDARVQLGTI